MMAVTVEQRFSYLVNALKKMGYEGDTNSVAQMNKFLSFNRNHVLYPKAIYHWNEWHNSTYQFRLGQHKKDIVRSTSTLDAAFNMVRKK